MVTICTTTITLTADGGTVAGGEATMVASGTLTGQGVWTYFKPIPDPAVVIIKHSNDTNNDKTVTISASTRHVYDYVATGSNSETIVVATS